MESENRIKFEEGKIYFFICYALVCGGKSTFFEQIQSQTNTEENNSKYNVKMVSSDQIRADLSHEMQKKNPSMTFKQCFDKLGKQTATEFDKQIQKAIDSKEDKEQKYSSINYYMEPGVKNYTPYMEYAPYMMRDDKWRDARLYNTADRTYNSRRMYMESKQNQATDQQSMKELEHYIKDLGDDLTDMIRDSSTEEKQVLSTKLQQLASKVTKP